jgi:di/tricarboxylate transporter
LVAFAAPRVVTWCRRAGISAAPYLMPLSYAAVIGGVVTVIGTSTNLVVSDLLVESGEQSLGIFEITPVGLPLAVVSVVVLTLTSHRLLGGRGMAHADQPRRPDTFTLAMRVERDSPLVGHTVQDAGLRSLHGVFLAGIERGGRIVTVRPETMIGADDICYFAGDVNDVVDVLETPGLVSAEEAHLGDASDRVDAGLYEVVVAERSELAGSTLSEVGFRAHYDAAVLAIKRHDDDVPGKLGTVVLRPGDVLLVLATPQFESLWRGHSDFSVIASLDTPPPPRRDHAWVVLVAIAAMITVAVANVLDLMEAALVAAALLVVFRIISVNEARRAINLDVVLTIALSVSLGTAVAVSGLAAEMASVLSTIGDPFGDVGKLVAVLVATMVLTELLSNNAAAAVMLPIATAVAADGGLDPRSMAIVVLIGASCSYLSPIGYQTNLMVYSLGGYRFADFTRLGAPLTLVTLIVTPIAVPLTIGL